MKALFAIALLGFIAGCSNMPYPSSSGGMPSDASSGGYPGESFSTGGYSYDSGRPVPIGP